MADTFDLIVKGGTVVLPGRTVRVDLGVRNGQIAHIGPLDKGQAARTLDCSGLHVLPGVIDTQVHFREPGLEHKEDLESGSRAAVLGGVCAVFEMPNTQPPTDSLAALKDKLTRARGRMWCDHAFFLGATPDNVDALGVWERAPGCCGVKVFMGSSTGSLLVDSDEVLRRILSTGTRRVAVHCEDEARLRERKAEIPAGAGVEAHSTWRDAETALRATRRLLALARATGRKVHVLHVTTAEEMALLQANRDIASVEVTPQHLTLAAPACYDGLGTFAQMNPPIRDAHHRQALWSALEQGIVDVIGSDHAPHTRKEKAQAYPASPSGMPGVQTLVPILLNHVNAGKLTLERFVDLTSAGPARLYDIAGKGRIAAGYDADLTIVDLNAERTITNDWIASKCGWTPFHDLVVRGWPKMTVVRGRLVMRDDEVLGKAQGQPVRFHPLPPAPLE
ncbi:dihydroorotase [Pararhodospirillum photometricum]|uniref:Dihydroorotase n=1 Tax=Pararhodospirillum photometricum DSM 122 TaxID=1150469 RepID=H6SQH3_PARPM|nr:dihydroorotase [Pararhodospirillum photometricum]CCG09692.1 Dihydroorotase [Pararhodospirillum photometricum DSM 122]